MQFFPLLLALGTSVAAIDTYLYIGNSCSGGAEVCINHNPGCCAGTQSSATFGSVAFRAIPIGWNIQGEGNDAWACRGTVFKTGTGAPDICLRGEGGLRPIPYRGAYYFFKGKKTRAEHKPEDCATANAIALANGTRFDIADLKPEEVDSLFALARRDAGDALHEYIHTLKLRTV